MKLLVAALALMGATARPMKSHKMELKNVAADSKMGMSLLSKARKLEQEEEEVDFTWVAGYSVIFQGCHHISQWNDEADGEEDVKIQTKRLVRFRLCPTGTCSETNAGGCNSGYGDYVIDMNEYLDAYLEAVEQQNEWDCKNLEENVCACNDDDGNQQGDDFDEEKCLYDCYTKYGKEDICADKNPYEDDEEAQEKFELKEYMECQAWDVPEAEDENERKLEEEEEEEIEYFLGPYCANNGGDIYLGLFTDDACTNFAAEDGSGGSSAYYSLSGEVLPYSYETKQSVVAFKCMSCKEPVEEDENNNGDQADEDNVIEFCEQTYAKAGKCESGLGIAYPNENACNYMEGIKIVRKNGVINSSYGGANKTATIFIGIFVVAFVLLAAYVFYLRTKLDRASINLSE